MQLKAFFTSLAMLVTVSSCIKKEAPNAEADILSCEVDGDLLIRKPVILNSEIQLYANDSSKLSSIAPLFTLTEGATISPTSGTVRDFTTPQTYTVTSQDGKWQKTYKVYFIASDATTDYHFENIRFHEDGGKKYFHIFYDTTISGTEMTWGSGNAGYMIANSTSPAENYPTSQAINGYKGKCAKLVTRSTGSLGALFGTPIAAGNLFTGSFKIDIFNPAKSTCFGVPFRKVPKTLSGYYKYKAGTKLTDKNNKEVPNQKDKCDIYAVLYEVTNEAPYLDGTNIKTHNNIVMMATLTESKETERWTAFSLPFVAVKGRKIDSNKLKEGKYNLAIVMSSSKGGAEFLGAVGSTLYVDEMHLIYQ